MIAKFPFARGLAVGLRWLARAIGSLAAAFWLFILLDIAACDMLAGFAWMAWERALLLGLTAASLASVVTAWRNDRWGGLALSIWGSVFSLIAYLTSSRPHQAFSILVSGAPFLLAGLLLLFAGWGERRSAKAAKVTLSASWMTYWRLCPKTRRCAGDGARAEHAPVAGAV